MNLGKVSSILEPNATKGSAQLLRDGTTEEREQLHNTHLVDVPPILPRIMQPLPQNPHDEVILLSAIESAQDPCSHIDTRENHYK